MKRLQSLFIFSIIVSCSPDKKVCDFTSDNEDLLIYNNILTDLVENRMHGRYLGGREEKIREEYYYDKEEVDTTQIDEEFTKAHNEVFNNPSQFCVLYLDTTGRQRYFYDSLGFIPDPDLKKLVNEYTMDERVAIGKLNDFPRYPISEFGLCTARLEYWTTQSDTTVCSIGRLRLSRPILNDKKDQGLMYYTWKCGELCGHGGLMRMHRVNEKWKIKDFEYWSVY
jgi:hypothetical protein